MLLATTLSLLAPPLVTQDLFELPRRLVSNFNVLPPQFRLLEDLDGDGDLDALSIRGVSPFLSQNHEVRLYFNDGQGEFQVGSSIDLKGVDPVVQWTSGDFNGDGALDLVALRSAGPPGTGSASWLRALPDSGFFFPPFAPTEDLSAQLGAGVVSLIAIDVDGDAVSELAVHRDLGGGSSRLEVFGFGWTSGAVFQLIASGPVAQVVPGPIEVVDLTGDGIPDLLARNPTGVPGLQALTLHPGQSGAIGAPLVLPILVNENEELVYGDLDADGDLDVARVSGTQLKVLRNVGGGVLSPEPAWTFDLGGESDFFFGEQRVDMLARDLDHDGYPELVGTISTSLGAPSIFAEALGASFVRFAGGPGSILADGPLGVLQVRTMPASYQGSFAGVGDVDGDGSLDLISGNHTLSGGAALRAPVDAVERASALVDLDLDGDVDAVLRQSEALRTVLNDGAGGLNKGLLGLPIGTLFGADIAYGADLDADGNPEVLVAEWSAPPTGDPLLLGWRTFELTPGGTYSDLGVTGTGAPFPPAPIKEAELAFLADVNGDGFQDLVSTFGYFPGDGAGGLGSAVQLVSGGGFLIDALDWESDGDIDLLLWDGGLKLLRADPAGFTTLTLFSALFFDPVSSPVVEVVDVDHDGRLDVLFAGLDAFLYFPGLYAALPTATGFEVKQIAGLGTDIVSDIQAGDFDGDGLLDVAVAGDLGNGGATDFTVFLGLGAGPSGGLAPVGTEFYRCPPSGRFADLDSDGDLDFVSSGIVAKGRLFEAPVAAQLLQYGVGSPGSAGTVPLLGATGQFAPGSSNARLRLVGAKAASFGALAIGPAPGEFGDLPLPGLTLLVQPPTVQCPLATDGQGTWVSPVHVPAWLGGLSLYGQAFIVDPGAPAQLSATNGLRVTFGL